MVTELSINNLIEKRWSPRAFSNSIISNEELALIFEATRWTASSMNEQPWNFFYAKRGSKAFDRMVDTLMPGNQSWAKEASHLIISLAKKHFNETGNVNRHAMHDVGAANTTLLLQAAELDIYGHMMGGVHAQKLFDYFEIDQNEYEFACIIALGYKGNPEQLDEPLKSRELAKRSRKEIDVFTSEVH